MKELKRNSILVILLFVGSMAFSQCSKESTHDSTQNHVNAKSSGQGASAQVADSINASTTSNSTSFCSSNCIASLPSEPLNETEISSLIKMREEELLAHDVYVELYALYKMPVFNNIPKAETQHAEAVKTLMLKYNLPDPAANHVAGIFVNADLQELFTSLVAKGKESLNAGLTVGATIEDLDINDLRNHILNDVDNKDILFVYGNLEKGSRNHLRSFYKLLKARKVTYVPQFISLEYFNRIISSPHETGPVVCPG